MRTCLGLVLLSLSSTQATAAQSCDTTLYPLSAPTTRFTDNGDGTVTDTRTHKMWMRCSLGQTWTGSACDGMPAAMSWQATQDAAAALNKAGGYAKHADWHVPHISELASIVEVQCADPRTNIAVFPNTPPAFYWTASNRHVNSVEPQAYMLSFGPEGTGGDTKSGQHYARLVRSSP
jgi:hypothetical protein